MVEIEILINIAIHVGLMENLMVMKIKYKPPDLLNIGYDDIFQKITRAEISNVLLQNIDSMIFVVAIQWLKIPDNDFVKKVIIVRDSVEFSISKNKSICIISSKIPKEISELIQKLSNSFNCFVEFPIIFEKNNIISNIVGSQENINKFLHFIDDLGIEYENISKRKYIPRDHGILSALTEKQYRCLELAVKMGYFDKPKGHDSRKLAEIVGINHSTYLEHLKKAEKKIFENLFRT